MTLTDSFLYDLSDFGYKLDDIETIIVSNKSESVDSFLEYGKKFETKDTSFSASIRIELKDGNILSFFPARKEIHDGNVCLFVGGFDFIQEVA